MSAQPVHQEPDPQDPTVILAQLPEQARGRFLCEYRAAVDAAYDPAGYHALRELLHTWRLLAETYQATDFHVRYQDITAGVGEYVAMDEVLPRPPA